RFRKGCKGRAFSPRDCHLAAHARYNNVPPPNSPLQFPPNPSTLVLPRACYAAPAARVTTAEPAPRPPSTAWAFQNGALMQSASFLSRNWIASRIPGPVVAVLVVLLSLGALPAWDERVASA